MTDPSLEKLLQEGLSYLKLDVPAVRQQALLAYIDLLFSWNRRFNLTAIRDPREMIRQHLLDALVALPYLHHGPILDVGSGAGVPGLPLAISRPDLAFTLIDSNGKKVRFIRQVVIALRLENVDVVQSRVENYQVSGGFSIILSRAFASLERFVRLTGHLLADNGYWLAWKAEVPEEEIGAVSNLAQIDEVIAVALPQLTKPRQLVRLSRKP